MLQNSSQFVVIDAIYYKIKFIPNSNAFEREAPTWRAVGGRVTGGMGVVGSGGALMVVSGWVP